MRAPSFNFAALFLATMLNLMAIAAALPVLPRYVTGPLGSGNVAVGVVIGAFAVTALLSRPTAGWLADTRGRKVAVLLGATLCAIGGALLFLPLDIPGVIAARLVCGAGEGMVFTAGSAWVVDLAPIERRGRVIGLYGLAIWSGLTVGLPIGELLYSAGGFDAVWAFCAAAPVLAALIATRLRETYVPRDGFPRPTIVREAMGPGLALALATVGYAAMSSFVVLHLGHRGIGHGGLVLTLFAASVVATRLLAGGFPDRFGPLPCATVAAGVEVLGLTLVGAAGSLGVALAGAMLMGAAFSTIYPSLSLHVVGRVDESRRGSAIGTFTAFFDLGVSLGAPLTGVVASVGGYPDAFYAAAILAAGSLAVLTLAPREVPVPA